MIRQYSIMTGLLLIAVVDCNTVRAGDETTAILDKPTFTAEQIEFFESEVRPVLVEHCFKCHSTDAAELQAGLYVDSRAAMLKGGESGAAVVVGKPMESLLIAAVKYSGTEMPPDRKLEQRKIEALIRWVEMGAPWPEVTSSPGVPAAEPGMDWATFDWTAAQQKHWAWQRVRRPEVPVISAAEPSTEVINPIDSFVVARRTQAGLQPVPPAAPHLLARRISIDLTGIPPTPERVRSFVKAASVDRQRAVEALVKELLESPMYGQRWARHWLDVARFSDGRGGFLEGDKPLDDAWRYRDWVVDAFNRDLPIDEFIHLQIAGDLTGDSSKAIATGFFALGPMYQSDGGDPDSIAQSRAETLDDRVDILTRGLLGITGSCARCHDHKFDPIPQQDYYSLAGIFNNSAVRDLPVPADDVDQRFNDHSQAVVELRKKIRSFRKRSRRNESNVNSDEAAGEEGPPEDRAQLDELTAELAELEKNTPPAQATAHTLYDTGSEDMKVALRGNLLKTGEMAPRRFLRIIAGAEPTRIILKAAVAKNWLQRLLILRIL
jgi:hypothetical protein